MFILSQNFCAPVFSVDYIIFCYSRMIQTVSFLTEVERNPSESTGEASFVNHMSHEPGILRSIRVSHAFSGHETGILVQLCSFELSKSCVGAVAMIKAGSKKKKQTAVCEVCFGSQNLARLACHSFSCCHQVNSTHFGSIGLACVVTGFEIKWHSIFDKD